MGCGLSKPFLLALTAPHQVTLPPTGLSKDPQSQSSYNLDAPSPVLIPPLPRLPWFHKWGNCISSRMLFLEMALVSIN